jgi:hypothetical protein
MSKPRRLAWLWIAAVSTLLVGVACGVAIALWASPWPVEDPFADDPRSRSVFIGYTIRWLDREKLIIQLVPEPPLVDQGQPVPAPSVPLPPNSI